MRAKDIADAISEADSFEQMKKILFPDDVPVSTDSMTRVMEHLIAKTGRKFTSMAKVDSRLREGFTEDDLKLIVDYKVDKWAKDDKMNEYLVPNTLFRSKPQCKRYLEEALNWETDKIAKEAAKNGAKSRMGRVQMPKFEDS